MENEKSRRPADTPFKQQRMAAWQPVLTPIKVILIFFVIGIVFIPVGVTLLDESNNVCSINYLLWLYYQSADMSLLKNF